MVKVSQFAIVALVLIVGIGALMLFAGGVPTTPGQFVPSGTSEAARLAGVSEPAGGIGIGRMDIGFDLIYGDIGAQDATADVDIDVLPFKFSDNAQLVANHLADCSGVVPAVWDGTTTRVTVESGNFCVVNTWKMWRDANFNAGDAETQFDDWLGNTVEADMNEFDEGSGTVLVSNKIAADRMYFVIISEGATTDDEDIVPVVLLIGSTLTSTLSEQSLSDGSIDIIWEVPIYSDADAESRTKELGECTDDTANQNVVSLDSNFNNPIHSSNTASTNLTLKCTFDHEITRNGYATVLINPVANAQSEMAYMVFDPWCEQDSTGSGATEEWVQYATGNCTGDVAFSAAGSTADQILWESSFACGEQLTDSSGTDAVKRGGENLYEPSCFTSSATKKNGITGIFDKGGKLTYDLQINVVQVDYDLAATVADEVIGTASGGAAGEAFFNFSLITLESSSDRIGLTLGGTGTQ